MKMTHQQALETVVTHLFKQGQRAIDSGQRCKYRAPDGSTCAVGCLIPDDVYTESMEGMGVWDIPEFKGVTTALDLKSKPRKALLGELQSVHDRSENWDTTETMRAAVRNGIYDLCLTYPSIKKLDLSFLNRLSFSDR